MSIFGLGAAKGRLFLTAGVICAASIPLASAQTRDAPADAQTTAKSSNSGEVETVVVTGKKSSITRSIDKKVYDQTDNPTAKTGTAGDVLNTVPSVNVSPDGDVTLRGSSNVQVYLNGKPSAELSGSSRTLTLQSMNGSDIASIEVITNPSAKYDANGSSIINIVLKKNREPGTNATLVTNIGNAGRKNAAANIVYTRQALSLHASASIREDLRPLQRSTTTIDSDLLTGGSSRREQNLSAGPHRRSFSLAAGADYDISDIDTIGAELSWQKHNSNNTIDEFNRDFDSSGSLLAAFDRHSSGPRGHTDTSERIDFTRKALSGNQWNFVVTNSETTDHVDRSYRDIYSVPAIGDQIVRVATNSDRRLTKVSGDGVVSAGGSDQLSFGFDFRLTNDTFANLNASVDPVSGAETVNTDLTNQSDIVRQIGAGYLTYQKSLGFMTALAGLRVEVARTSIGRGAAGPPIVHGDTNLNPTLHLNSWLDDDHEITASIGLTSQRAETADLNPFATYLDSQNVASGNPDLKLQSVLSAEIGYEFDGKNRQQTVTAYFRQSRHTVTDYSYFVSNDVLLTTKHNGGQGRSFGLEYELGGSLTPTLKYHFSANLFYAELQALDLTGTLFKARLSYSAKTSLDYSPTESDQFELDASFVGETITAQGTKSGTVTYNASWLHRITRKLFVTLRLNDITNGAKVVSLTRTDTVFRTDETFVNSREVFFGIRYNF